MSGEPFAQIPKVLGADVGQFMMLAVRPDVLHGVQFRRVGGRYSVSSDTPQVPFGSIILKQLRLMTMCVSTGEQCAKEEASFEVFLLRLLESRK